MRNYFSTLIILSLTACAPAIISTSESVQTSIPTIVIPTESEPSPMPQNLSSTNLEMLIGMAKEDLAERLSIPVSEIILLDARDVTWSNSSLGCPQPGMAYAEVLTPGYLILLQANDREYEYHASRGTELVHCDNPLPPVEGIPSDV